MFSDTQLAVKRSYNFQQFDNYRLQGKKIYYSASNHTKSEFTVRGGEDSNRWSVNPNPHIIYSIRNSLLKHPLNPSNVPAKSNDHLVDLLIIIQSIIILSSLQQPLLIQHPTRKSRFNVDSAKDNIELKIYSRISSLLLLSFSTSFAHLSTMQVNKISSYMPLVEWRVKPDPGDWHLLFDNNNEVSDQISEFGRTKVNFALFQIRFKPMDWQQLQSNSRAIVS